LTLIWNPRALELVSKIVSRAEVSGDPSQPLAGDCAEIKILDGFETLQEFVFVPKITN